ncbi:MAG: bifunctional DNA primase/polymerase [Rhodospirillaceae bacterium]
MGSKLDAALALAERGFKVFPIAAGRKAPPLLNDWPRMATCDTAVIRGMWEVCGENANVGIHCEGLLVVDVDPKNKGEESYALLGLLDNLPTTLAARTPSGGRHYFFSLNGAAVANSVGALGSGLDVRSANGYVVAAGSTTDAGVYAWVDADAPIAPAPEWLVRRCGEAPAERTRVDVDVADAPAEVVARALDWLRTTERSVKGQGGDQAAYRVACGLRDMGLSYQQTCEAMRSEAWDFGCGWRDGWLESKPIRSAYRYAQNEAGSRAALPDDFPVVPDSGTIAPKKSTLLRLDEFATQATSGAGYRIKNVLSRSSYAEVYGAPGEGKTFVVLDMGYHIAANREWMGHKVHGGPVLYLGYEGRGGLVARAKALRQHYGNEVVPFYVTEGAPFNIRTPEGRHALGALIAEMPDKPALIVFDTLAKALMGGDENSAQDVGAFNGAVEALIAATGACVLIVHHSGKDKSKGARGSSALLGAIDTEIQVDEGMIITQKQRDMEKADPIGFQLSTLVVGIDIDGDQETSCVVLPSTVKPAPGTERISGNAKRGFDTLCVLSPNNDPVDLKAWFDGCREFLPKAAAQRFYDLKRTLMMKGYIEVDNMDRVTRRLA